jgi:hypothetical protein
MVWWSRFVAATAIAAISTGAPAPRISVENIDALTVPDMDAIALPA